MGGVFGDPVKVKRQVSSPQRRHTINVWLKGHRLYATPPSAGSSSGTQRPDIPTAAGGESLPSRACLPLRTTHLGVSQADFPWELHYSCESNQFLNASPRKEKTRFQGLNGCWVAQGVKMSKDGNPCREGELLKEGTQL